MLVPNFYAYIGTKPYNPPKTADRRGRCPISHLGFRLLPWAKLFFDIVIYIMTNGQKFMVGNIDKLGTNKPN